MRVLVVQKDLFERSVGGAELYARNLARELHERHEVAVFCTGSGLPDRGRWHPSPPSGIPVYEVPAVHDPRPESDRELRLLRAFDEILESWRPDVIHVNDLVRLSPRVPEKAQRRSVPVVLTAHDFTLVCGRVILRTSRDRLCAGPGILGCGRCGFDEGVGRFSLSRRAGMRSHLRRARAVVQSADAFARTRRAAYLEASRVFDRILVPSRFVADRLIRHGVPAESVLVVAYGIPLPAEAPTKSPSDRLRVGFIGNPAEHKGIWTLLDAMSRAPDALLTVWGEPAADVTDALRQRASSLPNVELAGVLEEGAKARAHREIDVLAAPSLWWENQPITILEAFAHGTPVVASNVGGMKELLEPGGGWLVPLGDAAALESLFRHLAADRSLLDEAARGIPTVKSLDRHVEEIEEIYEELRRD